MSASPSALERLAAHSVDGLPHLLAARARTDVELQRLRARLAGVALDADVAVVLFGSWGRRELTEHSDDDWLLLVDGPLRDGLAARGRGGPRSCWAPATAARARRAPSARSALGATSCSTSGWRRTTTAT